MTQPLPTQISPAGNLDQSSTSPPPPRLSSRERLLRAWHQRPDTDYYFNYWTALGWTLLTLGLYSIYVTYQLLRRSRDHNRRQLELFDATNEILWEEARRQGLNRELQPRFERVAWHLSIMRQQAQRFRTPVGWAIIYAVSYLFGVNGVVIWISFVLIDQDLVEHEQSDHQAALEFSAILQHLGQLVEVPVALSPKGRHNYPGRIGATIGTLGGYLLWWYYDIMADTNRHYDGEWRWEDDLVNALWKLPASR